MSKSRKCMSYDTPILFDAHPMDQFREKPAKKRTRITRNPVTFEDVAKDNGFLIVEAIRPGVRLRV